MRYPALAELQRQVLMCRENSRNDINSCCHKVTEYYSAGGHQPLITVPLPEEIDFPVQILTVGINPRWTEHPAIAQESTPVGQIKGPDTFNKYKETILEGLPEGAGIAHVELVQCGTPGGGDVKNVIRICRERFFDKVVAELKPKVIVPIGQWASAHLYWYNTYDGKAGKPWGGIRKRHGTSERVCIGDHECAIVFTLQPSARVSHAEREKARNRIAEVFSA